MVIIKTYGYEEENKYKRWKELNGEGKEFESGEKFDETGEFARSKEEARVAGRLGATSFCVVFDCDFGRVSCDVVFW
ncbi:hypothetical protein IJG20_00660 [Candidatus Saccharibacteria bacterium]|nr:hypothetical protein [Candidatus Saccharibacteria bacterium]